MPSTDRPVPYDPLCGVWMAAADENDDLRKSEVSPDGKILEDCLAKRRERLLSSPSPGARPGGRVFLPHEEQELRASLPYGRQERKGFTPPPWLSIELPPSSPSVHASLSGFSTSPNVPPLAPNRPIQQPPLARRTLTEMNILRNELACAEKRGACALTRERALKRVVHGLCELRVAEEKQSP